MPEIVELTDDNVICGAGADSICDSDDAMLKMLSSLRTEPEDNSDNANIVDRFEAFDDDGCVEDDEDEDLDETVMERLVGLTEMFPERLTKFVSSSVTVSVTSSKWLLSAARVAAWVVASSAAILALPVMFENERSQMEQQQVQQQRQMLLGPNTALAGRGPSPLGN